jgi:hypothetical protein
MKKILTNLNVLLFATAILMSLNGKAEKGPKNNEQAIVTEIYLNIPNDGRVKNNTVLSVKTQLSAATGVRHAQIIQDFDQQENNQAGRELFQKDGKVDVDIIIRGLDLMPMLNPYTQTSIVRVKIASVISYITVDNISGVFQSNETGVGNSDIASRLVDVHVLGINDSQQDSEGSVSAYSIEVQNGNMDNYSHILRPDEKLISSDLSLFPNPAVGGNFFIQFKNKEVEIKNIQVFNTIGALVYTNTSRFIPAGQIGIQLNDIPSGVYFIRLSTSKGDIVKKFNVTK